MLVEQNTVMVEEREREIRQIVQSISDLNEIFRDLAGMVVEQVVGTILTCQSNHAFCIMPSYWYMLTETFFSVLMWFYFFQGTVLDRIDFNVEQACVKTEDGLKQLQKVNANGSCVYE